VIQVRLGHFTGKYEFIERPREGVAWETHHEFQLVPVAIDRPEHGVEMRRLVCPGCGERVGFRVASRRSVTTKRILLSGLLLALGTLAVVLFATSFFGLQGIVGAALWVVAIASAYLVLRVLLMMFTSDFYEAIVGPNTDVTLGSYIIANRDTRELNSHHVFPPTGELKSEKSLHPTTVIST